MSSVVILLKAQDGNRRLKISGYTYGAANHRFVRLACLYSDLRRKVYAERINGDRTHAVENILGMFRSLDPFRILDLDGIDWNAYGY